jgi:hypothetical protein
MITSPSPNKGHGSLEDREIPILSESNAMMAMEKSLSETNSDSDDEEGRPG